MDYDVNAIRVQLERLVSDHAGKGLNMLGGTGLMAVVLGEDVSNKMSKADMQAFHTVCKKNIDKTKPVRARRLGLLYTALSEKRGYAAIERLNFDEKTKKQRSPPSMR